MKDFLIGIAVGALGAFVAVKVADKEEREKIRGYIDDGISFGKRKIAHAQSLAQEEYENGRQSLERVVNNVKGKLD